MFGTLLFLLYVLMAVCYWEAVAVPEMFLKTYLQSFAYFQQHFISPHPTQERVRVCVYSNLAEHSQSHEGHGEAPDVDFHCPQVVHGGGCRWDHRAGSGEGSPGAVWLSHHSRVWFRDSCVSSLNYYTPTKLLEIFSLEINHVWKFQPKLGMCDSLVCCYLYALLLHVFNLIFCMLLSDEVS